MVATLAATILTAAISGGASATSQHTQSVTRLPAISISQSASRYDIGQPVRLTIKVTSGAVPLTGTLKVMAFNLGVTVYTAPSVPVNVPARQNYEMHLTWLPPRTDFCGYLVMATLSTAAKPLQASTAVDVSSTWTKYPRYGFLSSYDKQVGTSAPTVMRNLAAFHINCIQFYDWQYRHDEPIKIEDNAPARQWEDIAGRKVYGSTIRRLIAAAHAEGMACMNYNLIYGGWANYADLGVLPAWGLYSDGQVHHQVSLPMPTSWNTKAIDLFNPANKDWQNWLLNQEERVFSSYAFDGWQADQVGNLGQVYTSDGTPITLWKTFAPFLARARGVLHKALIFNNVGGYGLYDTAAHSNEDAVYVECWPPDQHTFQQLQNVINNAHVWSKGKAVILAAYMDRAVSNRKTGQTPVRFNTPGVLLTDATIFASGASHIELGDDVRLLGNEYFPNANLVAGHTLLSCLRRWYTFLTANEAVLQSGSVVRPAHVEIANYLTSGTAKPGVIWTFGTSSDHWRTVHLINMLNTTTDAWRDNDQTCRPPKPTGPLKVRIYTGTQDVTDVFVGTPDSATGELQRLNFHRGGSPTAGWIDVTLINLRYWDMLLLKGSTHHTAPGKQ